MTRSAAPLSPCATRLLLCGGAEPGMKVVIAARRQDGQVPAAGCRLASEKPGRKSVSRRFAESRPQGEAAIAGIGRRRRGEPNGSAVAAVKPGF